MWLTGISIWTNKVAFINNNPLYPINFALGAFLSCNATCSCSFFSYKKDFFSSPDSKDGTNNKILKTIVSVIGHIVILNMVSTYLASSPFFLSSTIGFIIFFFLSFFRPMFIFIYRNYPKVEVKR